jgi:hypothetical protein
MLIQLRAARPWRGLLASATLAATIGCLAATASVSCAQEEAPASGVDRVVYGPALPRSTNAWDPPPAITLIGKIQRLDQSVLEIVAADGRVQKLPSDRIERIEVAWASQTAAAAHERFAKQQYMEALKENGEVLRAGGIPLWQQCILLGELVEAAEAAGRPELAGQLFLKLGQQQPPDFLMAVVPLNWTSRELTPALEKAAGQWLEQGDDFAGLLGASWLLLTDRAQDARQRLTAIQSKPSKLLARLAVMQLWRASPPSETTGSLQSWMVARDSLLLPLQLGPSEFLAERLSRIGRTDLAVGEWMRIAALHPEHAYRARLALEAAQQRLSRESNDSSAKAVADWIGQLDAVQAASAP